MKAPPFSFLYRNTEIVALIFRMTQTLLVSASHHICTVKSPSGVPGCLFNKQKPYKGMESHLRCGLQLN